MPGALLVRFVVTLHLNNITMMCSSCQVLIDTSRVSVRCRMSRGVKVQSRAHNVTVMRLRTRCAQCESESQCSVIINIICVVSGARR